MRLLHASTYELKDFIPQRIPEYAILSHVWGKEEVLYQDVLKGTAATKLGWSKVKQCCRRAQQDGFEYVWIDTCCIDKTNSVELSMAINSMFTWYEQAAVCYAYLSDVDTAAYSLQRQLERSKWFTRGWTLQELLAPKFVVFIGQAWEEFGTRSSLGHLLESVTKIKAQHLVNFKPCTIATKLSWAASRSTTLVEDEAYCLLGLFSIHLSPIYGEGKNAFIRVQQELLKAYNDESILAWNAYASSGRLLAASPAAFHHELIHLNFDRDRPESFLTNKGLIISPLIYQKRKEDGTMLDKFLIPLNCGLPDGSSAIALCLKPTGNDIYQRIDCESMSLFSMEAGWQPTQWIPLGRRRICIEQKTDAKWLDLDSKSYLLQFQHPPEVQMLFVESFRANSAEMKRLIRLHESPAHPQSHSSWWDDSFIQMPFGSFICAEFEVQTSIFGLTIRRCDQALTVEGWSKSYMSARMGDGGVSFLHKPSPDSRTDFVELIDDEKRIHIQLKPRGWPAERNKLSPGARAFTVTISLGTANDAASKIRQESTTWQRLVKAVGELPESWKDSTEL